MAVYDFGIDETTDIKEALGDSGLNIGPATTPLNDAAVTEAVQAGARTVHALAFAKGLDNIDATFLASNESTHGMLKDLATLIGDHRQYGFAFCHLLYLCF